MTNNPSEERYRGPMRALGGDVIHKIRQCRVLVVGAGGVGCELLKNLVLSGFEHIEVIDLDTIDHSNLNRQFLFGRQHVGMSKSRVARESVFKYNPNANIKSHHGNIKDPQYGPSYVQQFNIVMNALDNLSARRHVNRVCLAADVPLIESGTEGYLGYCQPILKNKTECFECFPQNTPTVYPVCTIRSNPTKPIHCIVWAKMLFLRLFGKSDDSNDVTDLEDTQAPTNSEQLDDEEQRSIDQVKCLIEQDKVKLHQEKLNSFERWIFHKVFHTDVLYVCTLKSFWRNKREPKPLLLDELSSIISTKITEHLETEEQLSKGQLLPDQVVWSVQKCAQVFLKTTNELKTISDNNPLDWEKDDDLHLDFVTAAANLRCHIFNLERSSRFTVKSEAGNIIPAIATTNAIIAGTMVLEAIKILNKEYHRSRGMILYKRPSADRVIVTATSTPNPKCYVCGSKYARININIETTTLNTFINEVVKKGLNITDPSIYYDETCLYEATVGEEDKDDMGMDYQLPKTLKELNITDNALLTLEDFRSDYELQVCIIHQSTFKNPEDVYEIIGDVTPSATSMTTQSTNTIPKSDTSIATDDKDDIVVVTKSSRKTKRKRSTDTVIDESLTIAID